MAFRFRCPKCTTTSFSIERDSRSYAPRGQTHELIFSCRCGKQLFGEQIEKEYLRQKTLWESEASRVQKDGDGVSDAAYEAQRVKRAEQAREDERAQEARRKEEDRRWREQQKAKGDDAPSADVSVDGETCEWKDCNNPPRPNSKYCSRDCSNKNARHRYKRRKGRGHEEAA